jgi:tRNA-binding EMAP/Myf-like protein
METAAITYVRGHKGSIILDRNVGPLPPVSPYSMPRRRFDKSAPRDEAGWVCPSCENENAHDAAQCAACEESRPTASSDEEPEWPHPRCVCGIVATCTEMANGLRKLGVDVGEVSYFISGELEPVTIVSAAQNVQPGSRVIVAISGARVKDATGLTATVKHQPYDGIMSAGMLCDAAMLGWAVTAPPVGISGPVHRGRRRERSGSDSDSDFPAPMVSEAYLLPPTFAFKPGDPAPADMP